MHLEVLTQLLFFLLKQSSWYWEEVAGIGGRVQKLHSSAGNRNSIWYFEPRGLSPQNFSLLCLFSTEWHAADTSRSIHHHPMHGQMSFQHFLRTVTGTSIPQYLYWGWAQYRCLQPPTLCDGHRGREEVQTKPCKDTNQAGNGTLAKCNWHVSHNKSNSSETNR